MEKIALVIGNANYIANDFEHLANAVVDAQTIAANLKDRGFEIALHTDLDGAQMSKALTEFNAKIAATHSFAAFYYAGHGCEQHGLTYIHPVDMPSGKASAIPQYGVPLTEILGDPHPAATPRVLILDCCRTSESSWTSDERTRFEECAIAAGHRSGSIHSNTLIAYSTSSGEPAFDGIGSNGPYCRQLSILLLKHRLTVEDVFKDVCMQVSSASNGRQRPWFYSNLSSNLTFSDLPNVMATVAITTPHSKGSVAGLVKDPHGQRVITFRDGSSTAYCVDGVASDGHYSFKNPVQLITTWQNGLIVFDDQSTLQKEEEQQYCGVKLEINAPLCVGSSPDGNLIILGGDSSFYVVDFSRKRLSEVKTPNLSWYSALFLNETLAWIIGSWGELREIEFIKNKPIIRDIDCDLRQLLYTICRVDDSHVVIGGSQGKVFKMSLQTKEIIWTCELGKTVRTPAARMQSILHIATDNEIIRRFLFEPAHLTADQVMCLSDGLSSNDILFSASTTSTPVLIIASSEGLLYLLDHRDGQLIEVINNDAGGATGIAGVCFLDAEQFAVLDEAGTIRLYSLTTMPYESALRYVDEADWGG